MAAGLSVEKGSVCVAKGHVKPVSPVVNIDEWKDRFRERADVSVENRTTRLGQPYQNEPENDFVRFALHEGWSVSKRGWPDFLCISKSGEIFAVEVKPGIRVPSLDQVRCFEWLTSLGVRCYVSDGKKMALYRPAAIASRPKVRRTSLGNPLERSVRKSIADDWQPDERDISYALSKGYDQVWVTRQAEQFRDHHIKADKRWRNWNAAWRTWVQRAPGFVPTNGKELHPNDIAARGVPERNGPSEPLTADRRREIFGIG